MIKLDIQKGLVPKMGTCVVNGYTPLLIITVGTRIMSAKANNIIVKLPDTRVSWTACCYFAKM